MALACPLPLPAPLMPPPIVASLQLLASFPERRFQELERGLEATAAEMAALQDMGAGMTEYRATLDVASQQVGKLGWEEEGTG